MRCHYRCPVDAISAKFFAFFTLKRFYDLSKIAEDPAIGSGFVTKKTRGFFRHYYSYLISE